jgi:hypothetical protein
VPTHVVRPGEHLAGIAAQHGFENSDAIWNDPANADLRDKRKHPDVLMAGDEVALPDKVPKTVEMASGTSRRFVLHRTTVELRLRLRDLAGQPISGSKCALIIDGVERQATSGADGVVATRIDSRTTSAKLRRDGGSIDIAIGQLDPVAEDSGWQARLINLGYLEGPLRDSTGGLSHGDELELRAAIEEFQCDHGLALSGTADAPTRDALVKTHGC